MAHTILCWGDSNTYGYDPRGFFGGRYGPESRWCSLLEQQLGCRVVNCGENGRTTPLHPWEYQAVLDAAAASGPVDLLVLMLGTNDILMGYSKDPGEIAGHMEQLADRVQKACPDTAILLMAPPPMGLPIPELQQLMSELARCYEELADRKGLLFCDPAPWGLGLAYDGVHLSEAGHRSFARGLAQFLKPHLR